MGKRVFVIVDVESFRHEIGDVTGLSRGQRGDLHLKSVHALLEARGYEITDWAVALALVPTNKLPGVAMTKTMRRTIKRNRMWVEREGNVLLEKKLPRLQVLEGGFDGESEVGVDDIIVVRALIEADAIQANSARFGEEILILSHDSDLQHLAEFVDGVPTRIVGRDSKFSKAHKAAMRVGLEGLSDPDMKFLGTAPTEPPQVLREPSVERVNVQPATAPTIVSSSTVAVVDGYGIACTAATVLGISELPNAQSVRETLENLGFRGVNSIQFVLPDINLKVKKASRRRPLSRFARKAWKARREELNVLAMELQSDDDPGTEVRRGTLTPAHVPDSARNSPTRRGPLSHAKQHSTLISAMTTRLWLRAKAPDIVVVTDVPDVVVALDYLTTKYGHLRQTRIIRLGSQARPIHSLSVGKPFRLPFIVLTERRLAQLTRVSSRYGRALRSAIGVSPESSGLLHEQWRVVGFEPEVDGLRVRSIAEPQVEMVIMDTSVLNLSLNDVIDGKALDLAIYGNPNMPVDPFIAIGGGQQSNRTRPLVAEVTGRDSDAFHFDLNGDGIPDLNLPVEHDFRPVRPGVKSVLGYLQADSKTLRYVAVHDHNSDQPVRDEELAVVKTAGSDAASATINGREVALHAVQASTVIDLREGDSVLVINVGSGDLPHYVVLSSALGHSPLVTSAM